MIEHIQENNKIEAKLENKAKKVGRNDPCPCGSGKKYKKCCLNMLYDNVPAAIKEKFASRAFENSNGKSIVIQDNQDKEKMSALLADFASPLTDPCDDENSFREVLALAAIAWNAGLVRKKEGPESLKLQEILANDFNNKMDKSSVIKTIEAMIDRKEKYFSQYERFITDFELVGYGKKMQLCVISSPYNDKEEK